MEENKSNNIEITEMFMAKAGNDFSRCFYGTITREKNDLGEEIIVRGKINVHDGYILAIGDDKWKLGKKLDELIFMILDKGLHNDNGVFFKRYGFDYYLN